MSDVKNITSKILKDAEVERDSILAASEDEKNKIISKRVNGAKALESEILSKAEQEGKSKKDRIISSAKLKVRNDKLAQKQSVIDGVFDEALNKLLPTPLTVEEWVNQVNSVTAEQIVSVAKKIKEDSIFFLTGKEVTE